MKRSDACFELARASAKTSIGAAALALACASTPAATQRTAASTGAAPVSSAARCPPELIPYQPRPRANIEVHLPDVPQLTRQPVKVGDAYSVWGASYFLRSGVHRAAVSDRPVTIEGYITKTNLLAAPRCAVHPAAAASPKGCRAAAPAFWLGDTPNAAPEDSIKVLGWASSYAQIYEAIRQLDSGKPVTARIDALLGEPLPNPLPAVGAKVSVTGEYGSTFVMASSDAEADIVMGLLTYHTMLYETPSPELATLPGVRRPVRP